jgi:hypothetical protein
MCQALALALTLALASFVSCDQDQNLKFPDTIVKH